MLYVISKFSFSRYLIQPLYESRFDFVRLFTFVYDVRVLLFRK